MKYCYCTSLLFTTRFPLAVPAYVDTRLESVSPSRTFVTSEKNLLSERGQIAFLFVGIVDVLVALWMFMREK